MSVHTIEIQVDEQFRLVVRPEALHRAVSAALVREGMEMPCELTVVVSDDETLRELNHRYRDVDGPTDVLAFADETRGPFVGAPNLPRYLGDVIISFQRAKAQAAEAGHEVDAELQLLAVHGVLHLLGHDDVVEEERARMWTVQGEVLQSLGVQVHLPA